MNPLLKAALGYARRGWAVFPLEGKSPFVGSRGHLDATTDKKQIERWWREHPHANIGIRCSSEAGPIVIDVDGPSGRDVLHEHETRHGRLPPTLSATSGRPHREHLYFAPPKSGIAIKRTIKINDARLDLLGDGGYVVAPPSIHPKTGKPYRLVNHGAVAPLPESILRLLGTNGNGKPHRPAPPVADVIPEGQRDETLTSIAGSMRRRGMTEDEMFAGLLAVNDGRCDPPLSEAQVRKIARSIGKKPALPFDFAEPINDINLARRFARLERDELRYCPEWRRWLAWDGTRWAKDTSYEAERRAEAMVRGMLGLLLESVAEPELRERLFKAINPYTRRRRLDDVLVVASRREELVVTPDLLDRDEWLFNVENGTLDLRTGKLRPHDPADLLTKLAPVEFERSADRPRWDRFLDEITREDAELQGYLQRAVGYTLAGVVSEHALFFGYGEGANGKTTFLETLYALFGDYATTIDFETLLHHRFGGSSETRRDLPRLSKARFVMADEAPQNARWDERTIKKLTGGNTLSARWLYGEKFDFPPTHTIWCQANEQPSAYDPSHAFWRRMKCIPFTHRIPPDKQIKNLSQQLVAEELSGILNWALAGCAAWRKASEHHDPNPLAEPARVQKATRTYREDQDVVGEFIAARCERVGGAWTKAHELYRCFVEWWRDTRGVRAMPLSSDAFGKALSKRDGLKRKKLRGERGWLGVTLRAEIELT